MRRFLRPFLVLGSLAVVCGWWLVVHPFLTIAAGYCATIGALQYFGAGDSLETIRAERIPDKIGFVSLTVDEEARAVEARAFYVTSRAVFRDGLGATREETRRVALPETAPAVVAPLSADRAWPLGSGSELAQLDPGIDGGRFAGALERAFASGRGTHAVVVAHRGQLVFERYTSGHDRGTPLLGWSMTKSVTATLVGRLVQEDVLALEEPVPVREWKGDARNQITLDDLLRMRSGLEFYQDHATPFCDSLRMLFVAADSAAVARGRGLGHGVGEHWAYADGTSNILADLVLDEVSSELETRLAVPRELLFSPLGMRTAFISVDGVGNFVGSSLMYASARDWARFGQLYLQDGVWNGQRLLPAGWVDYVARPTPNSDGRRYGAHFWRIDDGPLAGVFSAQGYQGQYVFIDRERSVVLVRLGVEPVRFEGNAFAEEVLGAFPSEPRGRQR